MKKLLALCCVPFLLMLTLSDAMAGCSFVSGNGKKTTTVTLPTSLMLQKNAPPGTIIWDSGWKLGGSTQVWCSGANSYSAGYVDTQKLSSIGESIYDTNLAGVGIRVSFSNSRYTSQGVKVNSPAHVSQFNSGGGTIYTPESGYRVELISTGGDIKSGTMMFTQPFAHLLYNNLITNELVFPSIQVNVTSIGCTVSTPNKSVAMGNVPASRFTGLNSTPVTKDFTVDLDCDSGAKINASLSGTQSSDSTDTSVLALTSTGTIGVATGIGVQILYKETPLSLNTTTFLTTTTAEGPQSLNFQARYIQTMSGVTTGTADSTATLNLTYQ